MSKDFGTASIMVIGELTKGDYKEHTTRSGRYYVCYCWGIKVMGIGKVGNFLFNNSYRQVIITGEVKKDKAGIVIFASRVQPLTDYLKTKKIKISSED